MDRGPLDKRLIGGAIALSGYGTTAAGSPPAPDKIDTGYDEAGFSPHGSPPDTAAILEDCWLAVADALWEEGATLAYAGGWHTRDQRPLLQLLVERLSQRTEELSRCEERRKHPEAWLISFLNPRSHTYLQLDSLVSPVNRERWGLVVEMENYLRQEEENTLGEPLLDVVNRFRRRLAVTEASVARFAVGGQTDRGVLSKARMPGLAEELMLTLARGCPIYVAGEFGGAAADVGLLLGLSRERTGEVPASMRPSNLDAVLGTIRDKLRPPPWPKLPVTAPDAAAFFRDHALGSSRWPPNGLSAEENRRLFRSSDIGEVSGLVVQGLRRAFDVRSRVSA